MRDAECAESKEKSHFRFFRFLFFKLQTFLFIFVLRNCQFSMNFHDKPKNKNQKMNLSFYPAHCASFMKLEAKLGGEGLNILTQNRSRNSDWCQIYSKSVITIQIWFGVTRFRKYFSECNAKKCNKCLLNSGEVEKLIANFFIFGYKLQPNDSENFEYAL